MKFKLAVVFSLMLSVASAQAGSDSEPRKYAVISLIGDSLTVVTYRPGTGSQLDRNVRETIALPDAGFDHATLLAAGEALKGAEPSGSVSLLQLPSVGLGTDQRRLLDGQQFAPPEELTVALKKEGATHLLLITKHRAEANLQTSHSKTGSGMLEGLGYYIDRQLRMQRSDTGEVGIGFLAPYAYFKVSLIDLASSTVLKQHAVVATTTVSSARNSEGVDPWGALSPTQKITTLLGLVKREMPIAVTDVVQR
jgi:hypothetical protein